MQRNAQEGEISVLHFERRLEAEEEVCDTTNIKYAEFNGIS